MADSLFTKRFLDIDIRNNQAVEYCRELELRTIGTDDPIKAGFIVRLLNDHFKVRTIALMKNGARIGTSLAFDDGSHVNMYFAQPGKMYVSDDGRY